jgi:hypothetical protein
LKLACFPLNPLGYQRDQNAMGFLSESEAQPVVVPVCRNPRAAEELPQYATIPLTTSSKVERTGAAAEALVCTFEFHG